MHMRIDIGHIHEKGDTMKQVLLKQVKQGETFKRKADAKHEFVRNHYNRKDMFGPANYSCTNWDTGNEIFLKPSTLVFIDV